MFNLTINSNNVKSVQAIVAKYGYTTEIEQSWHEGGKRYIDLCIAPQATRYSKALATAVSRYQA